MATMTHTTHNQSKWRDETDRIPLLDYFGLSAVVYLMTQFSSTDRWLFQYYVINVAMVITLSRNERTEVRMKKIYLSRALYGMVYIPDLRWCHICHSYTDSLSHSLCICAHCGCHYATISHNSFLFSSQSRLIFQKWIMPDSNFEGKSSKAINLHWRALDVVKWFNALRGCRPSRILQWRETPKKIIVMITNMTSSATLMQMRIHIMFTNTHQIFTFVPRKQKWLNFATAAYHKSVKGKKLNFQLRKNKRNRIEETQPSSLLDICIRTCVGADDIPGLEQPHRAMYNWTRDFHHAFQWFSPLSIYPLNSLYPLQYLIQRLVFNLLHTIQLKAEYNYLE